MVEAFGQPIASMYESVLKPAAGELPEWQALHFDCRIGAKSSHVVGVGGWARSTAQAAATARMAPRCLAFMRIDARSDRTARAAT